MKKLVCMALALLMVIGCFAGCSNSESTNDSTSSGTDASFTAQSGEASVGNAIKIGGIGPLTGGVAIYGNAAKKRV